MILDAVPDRMAARVAVRRSFIDLPVPAEIDVTSAAEALTDGPSWLADGGRSIYKRDVLD